MSDPVLPRPDADGTDTVDPHVDPALDPDDRTDGRTPLPDGYEPV